MSRDCYARSCRKSLVCCTLIILTCLVLGNSQSYQDLSSDNILLKNIRDQVIRNEKSFNLVKMSCGIQFDYTIPKSELEIERYTAGRQIGGGTALRGSGMLQER